MFAQEKVFEETLVKELKNNGWKNEVLKYPTEQDLIDNWAQIIFENNQGRDRLNGFPLVKEEMDQLLARINLLKTPLALNEFINSGTYAITRMNPDDKENYGKTVSLRLFDRAAVCGGTSRYQIAEQPKFSRKDPVGQDRRGDLMLLINGMPVIHLELKRSGVPISEACNQIEKYSKEGIFTGLFSLVQVFVAMTPEETLYFANPGTNGKFKSEFYFHWADFNNEPINDWKKITESLLSIPMAHSLIGSYTIADSSDGILKVMRSYQYYAVNQIIERVDERKRAKWEGIDQLGGYIWHTTGSGKTMTSFKAAQLIAASQYADKVVFLMDRIELGTQSLKEYRGFADCEDDVQATEDTYVLISKLKSDNSQDTLIVSSIQKMSRIKDDADISLKSNDLEIMQNKKIVFIVDECHRSTFGDMLITIKKTFPKALFFGFTGTPIFWENEKKHSTTADIFGKELHRYSIADGIRDHNVLGFDPTMVMVYKDNDLREKLILKKTNSKTIGEVFGNPKKEKIYNKYMSEDMTVIESEIGNSVYDSEYRRQVADDICDRWVSLSRNGKYHGIFATSSIPDAIEYYSYLKDRLSVTVVVDPSIDNANAQKSLDKENGLKEVLIDYNEKFNMTFDIGSYQAFKKDAAARLAHKSPYTNIENKKDKCLDLIIVVNQLLTGFDSKWVKVLFLDKVMEYQDLIQAFSRTNRVFNNHEKPFGSIRYYRYPHTMAKNIKEAVKVFSGDRPIGLFVDHLEDNINHMNCRYSDIIQIFANAGIADMSRLPADDEDCAKFASLFNEFSSYLEAARIQGFEWGKKIKDSSNHILVCTCSKHDYEIMLQRYKDLAATTSKTRGSGAIYEIDPYLTEFNTGKIDTDYMDKNFQKYHKILKNGTASDAERTSVLKEIHNSYAHLSQKHQAYADRILRGMENGSYELESGMTLSDCILQEAENDQNKRIKEVHDCLGVDERLLRNILNTHVTEENLNDYGRFDALVATIDQAKAAKFYAKKLNEPPYVCKNRAVMILKSFILSGGEKSIFQCLEKSGESETK